MKNHHFSFKCEGKEALRNNTTQPTPSMAVGLRILIQTSHTTMMTIARPNSNGAVVTKPKTLPELATGKKSSQVNQTCFLQSCHLCNKVLRPDKDVYMYRGDLGFCSIECRERQIVVDEIKELEKSTKKMLASSRHCYSSNGGRVSETRLLREELRRRNQVPVQKIRPVFS